MKLSVFNQKAEKVNEVEVNDSIFASKVNDKVLAQYTYIYLSNQREGNASTKTKAEVSGGGRKPWAQKGTGRARAGTSRSPIWKGGGVTHGPTNKVNWKRKTTKAFRSAAFKNAFSKINQAEKLKLIDSLTLEGQTKKAVDFVNSFSNPKKVTLVTAEKNENAIKAFANIQNTKVITVTKLNPYDLLVGGTIILEEKALEYINQKWA